MGAEAARSRRALLGLDGMHCAACVARVERVLDGRATDVRVNLAGRLVEFAWDPARTDLRAIARALAAAGFRPHLSGDDELHEQQRARRAELARLGTSLILSMQVMMLAWPSYFGDAPTEPAIVALLRWAQWLLATPVVLYGGWPFFRNAWDALSRRSLNMDVPVALALAIAYLASAWRTLAGSGELWFDGATMFVLFLGAGRYLEGRTRALATARLRALAASTPRTAWRVEGAAVVVDVPVDALAAGDRVQVRCGEAVPVDGALLGAAAEFDEALLTGESRPVRREPGERVLAGSINVGAGAITLRAERLGSDTHLSHIARLLNRAQAQRPRFQLLADRLAGHFILAVMALAALGAWLAFDRGVDAAVSVALAVLVASCPCALSLAVPAAVAAASSRLAARGALLANPAALARLRDVDTVLFDKTGTLTQPGLAIAAVQPLAELDEGTCLALAAALERDSIHPIARAFAHLSAAPAVDVARYRIGAARTLVTGLDPALTWIELADEQRPLALFGLAAPVRPEAAAVVRELRARGCGIELLTGDAPQAAYALARRLDITEVHVRQSAEDKLARLRALQSAGRVVIAVGDGINDAPFLGGADVAVAMPGGAALAQARADVILLGNTLTPLPQLIDMSRRAMRVARQNLAWALAYNLAVLPLAMAGALAPWMAALGMSLSSLLVVANALRLGRDAPVAAPALGQPLPA